MDQLDRLFHRLVHNLRTRSPAHVSLPFSVAELYEQIVPYRHNRRELGLESNQDYELTVMRLLAGERGYLLGDAAMQEALKRELNSLNPDMGAFREYGAVEVSISPGALEKAGSASRRTDTKEKAAAADAMAENPPTSRGPQATAAGVTSSSQETAMTAPSAPAADKATCRYCGTDLPEGRAVKFCPKCGQNLAVSRCPACGSEIEEGWRFCITCGREAGT